MHNVMIDIETMGLSLNAPILSIGACFFDIETGEIGAKFECNIILKSALENGVLDADTLQWWLTKTSDEARAALFAGFKVDLVDALSALYNFVVCPIPVMVWANGPSFDVAILENAYRKSGYQVPWSHRNVQCVRTIKRLADVIAPDREKPADVGTAHAALDDCLFQVAEVVAAYKVIVGK